MVTMKDIALAAGTSQATVSRILNGIEIRDTALADRVQKVAKEMNYQPNEAGRSLRMGSDGDYGPVFEVRSQQNIHVKRLIAQTAAKFANSADVIVLDSGSTVAQMGVYLPEGLLVYTNSLAILHAAARRNVHVQLSPGLYVPEMAAVFGQETDEYFSRHHATAYFLSSARVDVKTGLFNLHPTTYSVKRVVLENAKRKILLADHHKFCDAGLDTYAPLSKIDILVTDFVPEVFRDAIFQSGVQVIETQPESR